MSDLQDVLDCPRAIVHLDLDAFFAAVEVLDDPALAGLPLIVGGRPEERGVVSTASYQARTYGVRSAMPTVRALQLCPEAVVLPPRHGRYHEFSRRVMAILHESSPLVEQISIDEAFLDLTGAVSEWEDAIRIARIVQQHVHNKVELSASLGVATNKLVAKVASDQDKPGGLTVVRPGEEAQFLALLPVRVLWGIGPVTEGKLAEMGVTTVGELAALSEETLRERFGRQGAAMTQQARGIDARPVVAEYERKSISQELTFARDIAQWEALKRHLWHMSQRVAEMLKSDGLAAWTVSIKLRYADFSTLTRQMSLPVPTDDQSEIYRVALLLLKRAWQRGRPVRLLGVGGHNLSAPSPQLTLW
ncbi:MAG: DNA polymerase IV [Anaerolineae bacterium]|nr:DNA polymerase IV [Anaerolineae bacterium]